MRKPVVSIMCTVRNGARHLGAVVDCVLAQSLREWELIVIDDGSSDDSAEIARARAAGDAKMQLAKLEEAAEGIYNGLTALSTVAADDSGYQGVIAVLTEYGYRPLQKEIEKLQDEADAADDDNEEEVP